MNKGSIEITCPACLRSLPFDQNQAGSVVPCSHCGEPIRVPGTAPKPEVKSETVSEDAASKVRVVRPLQLMRRLSPSIAQPGRKRRITIIVGATAVVTVGVFAGMLGHSFFQRKATNFYDERMRTCLDESLRLLSAIQGSIIIEDHRRGVQAVRYELNKLTESIAVSDAKRTSYAEMEKTINHLVGAQTVWDHLMALRSPELLMMQIASAEGEKEENAREYAKRPSDDRFNGLYRTIREKKDDVIDHQILLLKNELAEVRKYQQLLDERWLDAQKHRALALKALENGD